MDWAPVLINALFADSEGTLWIGTLGGGLTRFHEGRFATVNRERGLAQDVITQIIEDDGGNLWMGSRMGIFRARKQNIADVMDGKAEHIYCASYTKADGLLDLSFVGGFQPACMKSRDGRLWFCGPGGIVSVDPRRVVQRQVAAPVKIEKVIVDGDDIAARAPDAKPGRPQEKQTALASGHASGIGGADTIVLKVPPLARRLEFHYAALNFSARDQVQFRCKLERYDEDWQHVGTQRTFSYTRIPPGDYTFRVASVTGEPNENLSEAMVALVVLPHFRQNLVVSWVVRALRRGCPNLFLSP